MAGIAVGFTVVPQGMVSSFRTQRSTGMFQLKGSTSSLQDLQEQPPCPACASKGQLLRCCHTLLRHPIIPDGLSFVLLLPP